MASATKDKDVDQLKAELAALRDQIEAISDTLQSIATDRGERAQTALSDSLRGQLEAAQTKTRKAADAAASTAAELVAERPLASLLGALTVGMVIGTLLSKRT